MIFFCADFQVCSSSADLIWSNFVFLYLYFVIYSKRDLFERMLCQRRMGKQFSFFELSPDERAGKRGCSGCPYLGFESQFLEHQSGVHSVDTRQVLIRAGKLA